VQVTVDEDGNTISVLPLGGHPLLKDAATQAARGWKFKPALLRGHPVQSTGIITFNLNWRCESVSFGDSPSALEIQCDDRGERIVESPVYTADITTLLAPQILFPEPLAGGPMPRQYWLTGRVVDDHTGFPVPGAIVEVGQDHKVWSRGTTNERGEFSFYDVPATRIDLKGSAGKHIEVLLFRWPGTRFSASPYTRHSKTITVTDADGKGIPGARTITLRIVTRTSVSGVHRY
jgi:hypothetical protein